MRSNDELGKKKCQVTNKAFESIRSHPCVDWDFPGLQVLNERTQENKNENHKIYIDIISTPFFMYIFYEKKKFFCFMRTYDTF